LGRKKRRAAVVTFVFKLIFTAAHRFFPVTPNRTVIPIPLHPERSQGCSGRGISWMLLQASEKTKQESFASFALNLCVFGVFYLKSY